MYEKLNPKYSFLAGCDEVGRGPLAGPVVASTVYLNYTNEGIKDADEIFQKLRALGVTDSKKLSTKKRQKILDELTINFKDSNIELFESNNCSLQFNICEISPTQIDEINILNASMMAMQVSFKNCYKKGERGKLFVDGNRLPKELPSEIEAHAVVKGDSKVLLIGLASIIAKEYRDQLMIEMGNRYPGYGFESHSGYPTSFHKEAIKNKGITPIHRLSFKGVKEFV